MASQHIHILGIGGTFMGGVAQLARGLGYRVSGSDANIYPPMSTQLEASGIALMEGYLPAHLQPAPDLVVVGNVMSRGNPAVEYMLNQGLSYVSGPQWLGEHLLKDRWVVAIAGTHGKTTTTSMVAWIMDQAGLAPGFLVGGVPGGFQVTARLGASPFFVVEADEYDTAFFDKRSKFVHYRPRTLVLNNLEYDHADIFPDLDAIKVQFHHLLRIVPGDGRIIANGEDNNLAAVLAMGCWTPVETFSPTAKSASHWSVADSEPDGSAFTLKGPDGESAAMAWNQIGAHNVANGLAAIAASHHAGVTVSAAVDALARFPGVRRRMEVRARVRGITVYDDFAHHPTAIATTLAGLRARVQRQRIVVVLEPRSNTMRQGVHRETLAQSLQQADRVELFQPEDMGWGLEEVAQQLGSHARVETSSDRIVDHLAAELTAGDQVVIMSNGAFGGLHDKLIERLKQAGT
jgi:UDP-N-acetylmuramate: L-alanyl-gamma-D-glutamyl-meso-diaminopimelate ligase